MHFWGHCVGNVLGESSKIGDKTGICISLERPDLGMSRSKISHWVPLKIASFKPIGLFSSKIST